MSLLQATSLRRKATDRPQPEAAIETAPTSLARKLEQPTSARRDDILAFATQGAGGGEEARLRRLLAEFSSEFFPYDRNRKLLSFIRLLSILRRKPKRLVVMEGSGFAGGLSVVLGRLILGIPYVVSSGDAIGPYLGLRMPALRILFGVYERALYRLSSGVIGWTPYLVGRALTLGAPRAMTAAGWAQFGACADLLIQRRSAIRERLNIPEGAIVVGIVGALNWNKRLKYCYGRELIDASARIDRDDLYVLIVGSGSGKNQLERLAGARLGRRVFVLGSVPRDEVPAYLAALDVASLPQSVDRVGSFRYTTKLSEYVAIGLPIITGQIPLAYDLDSGWMWRLPGSSPWNSLYLKALAQLLSSLSRDEIERRRVAVPRHLIDFNAERQVAATTEFLRDILGSVRE
jgi:glycosyltransferase involved in cell wall biosynthesis